MPDYYDIEESLIVSNEGTLELKYTPFSAIKEGLIKYNPPEFSDKESLNDIEIIDKSTDSKVVIYSSVGNKIAVDIVWAGRAVTVKYKYCNDQIDAILLDHNNNYYRSEGILSTSPSKTDIDLTNYYIIGFARWTIGDTIDVEFIVDDRTYRKVYVDNHNILYLNGKPYKEAQIIYFEEPSNPTENTLWYDRVNNALCIWKESNGVYGWTVINDFSDVPIRKIKMWTPDNFPQDMQTFLFDDDEVDLRYIPDTNSLSIVIDQQVIMNDQFDEVVQSGAKAYLSSGVGFRLKNPLDRETYVQCAVNHVVRNGALRNVFQRAAIFITENYYTYSPDNISQVFKTDLQYAIGASQLEVWVDGVRLNKNVEYIEVLSDGTTPATSSNNDNMTDYFMITTPLTAGQKVTYKISRYVWSYDQLNVMMQDIESKADDALALCGGLQGQIDNIITNFDNRIKTLQNQINVMSNTLSTLSDYRLKSDIITLTDVDSDIRDSLFKSSSVQTFNAATVPIVITDVNTNDVIRVDYMSNNSSRPLIENAEYTVNFNSDGAAYINLISTLISTEATVIVSILRFGK